MRILARPSTVGTILIESNFNIKEETSLDRTNTVIVGGGQAGLAISSYLKQEGREHVVLERAPAVANAWHNQRWNSFTLVTPNFQVRMPSAEYRGSAPWGFMPLAEVVKYFDGYVDRLGLPVHCRVEVRGVEKRGTRYMVRTSEGDYEGDNVVIATGLYQSPRIPRFSADIAPNILQIHSSRYRNDVRRRPAISSFTDISRHAFLACHGDQISDKALLNRVMNLGKAHDRSFDALQ